jgi:hypothetical protein
MLELLPSWDGALRALIYLVIGTILVMVDVLFVRSVRDEFYSDEVVIAPFQIIGAKDDDGKLASNLAYLLQARLRRLEQDLAAAQESLKRPRGTATLGAAPLAVEGIAPLQPSILPIGTLPVHIGTQLFEATNIKLAVGGVDVGSMLPVIQKRIVRPRTISFSVIFDGDRATVDGNVAAFVRGRGSSVHLETASNSSEIASGVAAALIQLRLSALGTPHVEELSADDFGALLNVVLALNRQPSSDDFAKLVPSVEALARKVPRWTELVYLAAAISERAGQNAKALSFYQQLQQSASTDKGDRRDVYASIKDEVAQRIQALQTLAVPADVTDRRGDPKSVIESDIVYANTLLNAWFDQHLAAPGLKLTEPKSMLSFWDGTDVNLPPQAQFLPDLTYHETAQAFVSRVRSFTYQGESGSIQQSYANVLASLIKQERSGRKGREADWILVPGAVAWLKGESVENPKDMSPLISLKAPGTAYNDPAVGKDPQVASYDDRYKGNDDAGGVHINVGIPNKAFYETAVELGSDRAREMWRAALPKLPKTPKLQTLADQIYREAKTDAERQAVKDAWAKVGINTPTTT